MLLRRTAVQWRGYKPGIVTIGEGRAPKPLPNVQSSIGQKWVGYDSVVERRAGQKVIDIEMFKEFLEKTGLDVGEYTRIAGGGHGHRRLYVAVGTDLSSVVLLITAQQWVAVTRHPISLYPIAVKLNFLPAHQAELQVVYEYCRSRSLPLRMIEPTDDDYAQVASVYGDVDWASTDINDERVRLLIHWTIYSRVKLLEKHPFGTTVLFGTTLDRNLQKIADTLVPNDVVLSRNRRPAELWHMSMEGTPSQLPMLDTVNADWKQGQVMFRRPLLACTIAQVVETAMGAGIEKLVRVLSLPPPVYARLDRTQSHELLKLVKRCHVRTRAMRKLAQDYIARNARLDYKLGWSTLKQTELHTLPEEAVQYVVAALVAFSSSTATKDWLKDPPQSVKDLVPIVLARTEWLPSKPVLRIEGTGVSMVYGTPYKPDLSQGCEVFSFVPDPEVWEEPVEMPEWVTKNDSHTHAPTKCMTGITHGKWLVQLFASQRQRERLEDEGRVFWVTRLRPVGDKWWNQVVNGDRFQQSLANVIHDTRINSNSHPTRPSKLLLKDIPLVLMGSKGLEGPVDEDIPEASHLYVVGCPPFGYWAPQLKNHVWQGGMPRVHKCPGNILKPQWLLDFLPIPGLLGPLFVPLDRQVAQQIKAAEHMARKAPEDVFGVHEMSGERYKRLKAAVVRGVMDTGREVKVEDTGKMFLGAYTNMKKKGELDVNQKLVEEEDDEMEEQEEDGDSAAAAEQRTPQTINTVKDEGGADPSLVAPPTAPATLPNETPEPEQAPNPWYMVEEEDNVIPRPSPPAVKRSGSWYMQDARWPTYNHEREIRINKAHVPISPDG